MSSYVKHIHEALHEDKQGKWGWVIYRTSYKNDAAWERFRDCINISAREALKGEGASPLVLDALDCIFVSDPALDGASRKQLRERFLQWRQPAIRVENPQRALPKEWDEIPSRYVYFVQVDDESLDSVVQASAQSSDTGWVRFVRCDQEVDLGPLKLEYKWEQLEDYHWKMLASRMLSARFYSDVWDTIHGWDWSPDIDDVMKIEAFQMERAASDAAQEALLCHPRSDPGTALAALQSADMGYLIRLVDSKQGMRLVQVKK
ncbi:hypothetical protein NEMBOFW57_005610 [Staphylotrichum longicolle]|uniref:Uncharacterized protein n=1 Tax=Staphylotrichum longicolle TaxID=669026 RepID=A0AAD4I0G0_9PEZI|nr:hypothetical protein NEMBOFW57_005610 [Staphylotrichum longicolle]